MVANNDLIALKLIRRADSLVRTDLARQMGISLSLVSKITSELQQAGLIHEVGRTGSELGRPADLLALNPQAGYALGLDIGGECQVAVLTDLAGEVIVSLAEPSQVSSDRQVVLHNIQDLIHRLVASSNLPPHKILGVGVGVRTSVDPLSGITLGWPDNTVGWGTVWVNFPLRQMLVELLPSYPHLLVDDIVRPLGLAEAHYGQGRLDEDFIYILVDMGVGMAILLQGTPYIGYSHIAGEIGHLPISGHQDPCLCGNFGCLENLTSTEAILKNLKMRLAEAQVHSAYWLANREINIEAVLEAAASGDKLTYQLLTQAGEDLGQALAVVLNLFGPRLVVIGGALSCSPIYLDAACRIVKLRALEQTSRVAEITCSQLGSLAGARGASTLILNALFESLDKNILSLI